jgi:hypothetical protein
MVVCGTLHNSTRLESYGHEKLENQGLGNGPKFVLMDNGMSFDIFEVKTILDGLYMSFHFWWYVECQINPHSLRVMALQSWRMLRT